MNILTICGSSRPGSQNQRLLDALPFLRPSWAFDHFDIGVLPLFKDLGDGLIYPDDVLQFRTALVNSKALIISTPEYSHNIPAQLKNALEWVTASGEITDKKVLPIVFTPHPPRGEKAMVGLLNVLKAMNASIPVHLHIHQNECRWNDEGSIAADSALLELLNGSLDLINSSS